MGFWSSLRGSNKSPPAVDADPPEAAEAAAPLSPTLIRLLAIGSHDGPTEDEAAELLASLRVTPEEGIALDGLVRHTAHGGVLPDRLLIATASALVDRGDRTSARALLVGSESTSTLLMRADLAAEDGDLPLAIATIERVLLRDLDTPGASERRQRWRARLGLGDTTKRADPATMTVATAKPRAPFNLVAEVARGGAGVVYEAFDRELGRRVALKLYHRHDRDRAQLLHEATVAASLEGPGVVRVFDVDPNDGWLALEWAASGALRDLLRRDRRSEIPPLDTWVVPLARALARVHAAGWVHHDVKPANVLISEGGTPWLADFGSARREGEPSPPGSMGYVSPERLLGRGSDPSDDVYGFGRILEDTLAAAPDTPDGARWRRLACICTGPSFDRPTDGSALVSALSDW